MFFFLVEILNFFLFKHRKYSLSFDDFKNIDFINYFFFIKLSKFKLCAPVLVFLIRLTKQQLTESAERKLKFDFNFVFLFLLQNPKLIEQCRTKVDAEGEAAWSGWTKHSLDCGSLPASVAAVFGE